MGLSPAWGEICYSSDQGPLIVLAQTISKTSSSSIWSLLLHLKKTLLEKLDMVDYSGYKSIHKCKVNGWLSCFPFLPMHSCYSSSTSLYTMAGNSKFCPKLWGLKYGKRIQSYKTFSQILAFTIFKKILFFFVYCITFHSCRKKNPLQFLDKILKFRS